MIQKYIDKILKTKLIKFSMDFLYHSKREQKFNKSTNTTRY